MERCLSLTSTPPPNRRIVSHRLPHLAVAVPPLSRAFDSTTPPVVGGAPFTPSRPGSKKACGVGRWAWPPTPSRMLPLPGRQRGSHKKKRTLLVCGCFVLLRCQLGVCIVYRTILYCVLRIVRGAARGRLAEIDPIQQLMSFFSFLSFLFFRYF